MHQRTLFSRGEVYNYHLKPENMLLSFRTELIVAPSARKLSLRTPVLTAGSCFAEVIGRKIKRYKVPALVNPFGTIFNPVSLAHLLTTALNPKPEYTGEVVQRDGLWLAYDFHSSLAAHSRAELVTRIEQTLQQTGDFLREADTVILTFGTAVGYTHRATGTLVANCHKIPQAQFAKRFLTAAEITAAFSQFQETFHQINPSARIILTVSPVRHLKETLEGNSVSKSILRVACHELTEHYKNVDYFPAYELLLDDLRDYRFYQPDLLHPTSVAEEYIWDKFKATYFDESFQQFAVEWDSIQRALAHEPFHPASVSHQNFLRQLLARLEKLTATVDCQTEISRVKEQILPG